ncbi:MAG: hypothetical protein ABSB88_12010 [Bryobacteraceae bacterium]|jgi:hypothetical protein
MKRSLILVGLCTAASLFAQGPPPGRAVAVWGFGPGGPEGGMMPGMGRTVTGAPYSGVEVRDSQQILPNGNVITNHVQSNVARDSSGRVRTETTLPARGPAGSQSTPRTIINVHDPVAGVMRTIDPQAKTVREVSVRPGPGRGANGNPAGRPFPQGRGAGNSTNAATRTPRTDPNTVTETLAMQTINGVQATGTRVTRTIPAGQIGNAQPIQIVHETWMSADLKVPVMVKTTDPRNGTTTTQLTNITRAEPDPALFQAPSDYTLTKGSRGPGGMRGGPGGGGQIR